MSAITDIWNSIHTIITTSDWITLGIIAVIALALAWFSELASAVTTVFVALVVFGVANVLRGAVQGGSKTDFSTLLSTDWHNAMILPTQTLLAYAIIFAVVIVIVGIIKSVIGR
jgi:hypothetical protein